MGLGKEQAQFEKEDVEEVEDGRHMKRKAK